MPDIDEIVSETFGFKITPDNCGDGIPLFESGLDLDAFGTEHVHLLDVSQSSQLIAISNGTELKLDQTSKLDAKSGDADESSQKYVLADVPLSSPSHITQVRFNASGSLLYVVNDYKLYAIDVKIQPYSLKELQLGEDVLVSTILPGPGDFIAYLTQENELCMAEIKNKQAQNVETIADNITAYAWDEGSSSSSIYDHLFYAKQSDIKLFSESGDVRVKFESSDEVSPQEYHIIHIASLSGSWFVVYESDDSELDDHQIKSFVISKEGEASSTDIAEPFGGPERIATYYTPSLYNWISGRGLNIVSSSLVSEWATIGTGSEETSDQTPYALSSAEDTARATFPLDPETSDDLTPIGAALDLTRASVVVDSPCPGVDKVEGLPKLFTLLNNGALLSWWVVDKKAFLDGTANLANAATTLAKFSKSDDKPSVTSTTNSAQTSDADKLSESLLKTEISTEKPSIFGDKETANPFAKPDSGLFESKKDSLLKVDNPFGTSSSGAFKVASEASKPAGTTDSLPKPSSGPGFGQTGFGGKGFGSSGSGFGQTGFGAQSSTTSSFGKSSFGSKTTFGASTSGSSPFAALNQSKASPFADLATEKKESPFGNLSSKSTDSPFGNLNKKESNSPFGNLNEKESDSPFGNLNKKVDSDSPFANLSKEKPATSESSAKEKSDSPFGNLITKEKPASPFGNLISKEKQSLPFGNVASGKATPLEDSATKKPNSPFGNFSKQETSSPFGNLSTTEKKPTSPFGSLTQSKPALSFGLSSGSEKPASPFGNLGKDSSASFGSTGTLGTPKLHAPIPLDGKNIAFSEPEVEENQSDSENDAVRFGKQPESKPFGANSSFGSRADSTEAETGPSLSGSSDESFVEVVIDSKDKVGTKPLAKSETSKSKSKTKEDITSAGTETEIEELDLTVLGSDEDYEDYIDSEYEVEVLTAKEIYKQDDFLQFAGLTKSLDTGDKVHDKLLQIMNETEGHFSILDQNFHKLTKQLKYHLEKDEINYRAKSTLDYPQYWRLSSIRDLSDITQEVSPRVEYSLESSEYQEERVIEILERIKKSQAERILIDKLFSQAASLKNSTKAQRSQDLSLDLPNEVLQQSLRKKLQRLQNLENELVTKMMPLKAKTSPDEKIVKNLEKAVFDVNTVVQQHVKTVNELEAEYRKLKLEEDSRGTKLLTNKPNQELSRQPLRNSKWELGRKFSQRTVQPKVVRYDT